jgi:hypothetical protein
MLQLLSSLHRVWYIQETEQTEKITASILNVYRDDMPGHNLFNENISIVSGDHCQDGTSQKVSTLTPIRFIEQSQSINTKHSANESQNTGGRKKKNKSVVLKSKVKRNETRKKRRRLTKRRRRTVNSR